MSNNTVSISARVNADLLAFLDNEAASEMRDRSNMIEVILRERYKRKPRLDDKLTRGTLKKGV